MIDQRFPRRVGWVTRRVVRGMGVHGVGGGIPLVMRRVVSRSLWGGVGIPAARAGGGGADAVVPWVTQSTAVGVDASGVRARGSGGSDALGFDDAEVRLLVEWCLFTGGQGVPMGASPQSVVRRRFRGGLGLGWWFR